MGSEELVAPGTLVNLSGSDSYHFGHREDINYEWVLESIPHGSSAQIYFPNREESSFYADVEGVYLVRLIVSSEDADQLSLPSYKVVRAGGQAVSPPLANAGQHQNLLTGGSVNLSGSVSYTGSEQLSYSWKVESSPANSKPVLTNSETLTPTFTTDTDGLYIISFVGEAGGVKGIPGFVRIFSTQKPVPLVLSSNIVALTDQVIPLDSSLSFDPKGFHLGHSWSIVGKPMGSSARVANPSASKTSFSADTEGNYVLQLQVENPYLSADPNTDKNQAYFPKLFSGGSWK